MSVLFLIVLSLLAYAHSYITHDTELECINVQQLSTDTLVNEPNAPSTSHRLSFQFQGFGKDYVLDVERYTEIFHEDYKEVHLDADSNVLSQKRGAAECLYKGTIRGDETSLALLTNCEGILHGSIRSSLHDVRLSFEPRPVSTHSTFAIVESKCAAQAPRATHTQSVGDGNGHSGYTHVVYKSQTHPPGQFTCGTDLSELIPTNLDGVPQLDYMSKRLANVSFYDPFRTAAVSNNIPDIHIDILQKETHTDHSHFRTETACSGTQHYAGIILTNEYTNFLNRGSLVETFNVQMFVYAMSDYLNSQFGTSCVQLNIVGQVTFSEANPSTFLVRTCDTVDPNPPNTKGCWLNGAQLLSTRFDEYDISGLLSTFTTWSRSTYFTQLQTLFAPFTGAQLVSGLDMASTVIGLANTDRMCTNQGGCVIQATFAVDYVGCTAAHELGHLFSMVHDTTSGYIMYPSISSPPATSFSPTSINAMVSFLSTSPGTTCLNTLQPTNNPVPPFCGDGIVDAGESCDLALGVTDSCCNTATCQFNPGCECLNMEPCCQSGTIVSSSPAQVGRAAIGVCDVTDYCDGWGGIPPNFVKPAGGYCRDGQNDASTCYLGVCVLSRTNQCSKEFGYQITPCSNSSCGRVFCQDSMCGCCTYSNPNDGMLCNTDGLHQCVGTVCKLSSAITTYMWVLKEWATCSGGIQYRNSYCYDQSGNQVSLSLCASVNNTLYNPPRNCIPCSASNCLSGYFLNRSSCAGTQVNGCQLCSATNCKSSEYYTSSTCAGSVSGCNACTSISNCVNVTCSGPGASKCVRCAAGFTLSTDFLSCKAGSSSSGGVAQSSSSGATPKSSSSGAAAFSSSAAGKSSSASFSSSVAAKSSSVPMSSSVAAKSSSVPMSSSVAAKSSSALVSSSATGPKSSSAAGVSSAAIGSSSISTAGNGQSVDSSTSDTSGDASSTGQDTSNGGNPLFSSDASLSLPHFALVLFATFLAGITQA